MTETVLIVEDEHDLVKVLEYNLKREGYKVLNSLTGAEALRQIALDPLPDLILLDLMLPDISGTDICRQIRQSKRTRGIPVLMLTAKSEETDRIVGFEVGADDYVTKPFSVRELMLRIHAILRRSLPDKPDQETVVFGSLTLDVPGHRVLVDSAEVILTALEFRLLITLVDRRGRVQTREVLLSDVWDVHADVTTRTVDTHVKRLREKLGSAGAYIETIRGVGYRLCSDPDQVD
ncbi:MAG: response regulator transcription factor [Proteobacteria bacterium]|nr:response regulator transcription factor [Pseudomonadota bacterium]